MGIKNIENQKFGKLTAISFSHTDKQGNAMWKCKCDCGNEIITRGSRLRGGRVKSCGCLSIIKTIHDMKHTKFYRIWCAIKQRCGNKNAKDYRYYGANGIKLCKRWHSFISFKNDMYDGYLEHKKNNSYTSIDRINPFGDYELSNCKWANRKEQQKNTRKNYKNPLLK